MKFCQLTLALLLVSGEANARKTKLNKQLTKQKHANTLNKKINFNIKNKISNKAKYDGYGYDAYGYDHAYGNWGNDTYGTYDYPTDSYGGYGYDKYGNYGWDYDGSYKFDKYG